ncbi:hypothetical protein ACHMWU_02125 [Aeromicrobium sp. UC242_57]
MAPNPLLSREARRRNDERRAGALAIGTLVDWREVSSDGFPRVVLMLDVTTPDGHSFSRNCRREPHDHRAHAPRPGTDIPVRYRPAHLDHYVALARDADPADVQQVVDQIRRGESV